MNHILLTGEQAAEAIDSACSFACVELSESERERLIRYLTRCLTIQAAVDEMDRVIGAKKPGVKPGFFNHGLGI